MRVIFNFARVFHDESGTPGAQEQFKAAIQSGETIMGLPQGLRMRPGTCSKTTSGGTGSVGFVGSVVVHLVLHKVYLQEIE